MLGKTKEIIRENKNVNTKKKKKKPVIFVSMFVCVAQKKVREKE